MSMETFLQKLKLRCHNILYATTAFVPLAKDDYAKSQKLSALFSNDPSLVTYLNTLFKFAITVGAILAVLRLLYAGYMYMASDVFTSKEKAKEIFKDVFLGLFLLLSIFIILRQINPNLLNLEPKITPLTPAEMAGPTVPTPAPTPGVGCPTDCVGIPNGIRAKYPGKVSTTMANKLTNLIGKTPVIWWVTEAWPPTVTHASGCHGNGTCIDANFMSAVNASPDNINAFISAASSVGLTAKWEVGTSYNAAGINPVNLLVVNPPPNAPHFHITGG
jgi:hypothetical protein